MQVTTSEYCKGLNSELSYSATLLKQSGAVVLWWKLDCTLEDGAVLKNK